ncbi:MULTISPECIES: HNH endonuclease [Cupriavidus]
MTVESIAEIDAIRRTLRYEPGTGRLIRLKRCGAYRAGTVAGTRHCHGYVQVSFRGRFYLAHRLAWVLTYGEWPAMEIDHINGDKQDNRLANLRLVTRAMNQQNHRRARKDNHSCGLLGASNTKSGRWQSKIQLNGKTIYLGTFDTAELAHQAYVDAKRRIHAGGTL